jgi:hypothetical protein
VLVCLYLEREESRSDTETLRGICAKVIEADAHSLIGVSIARVDQHIHRSSIPSFDFWPYFSECRSAPAVGPIA